MFQLRYTNSVYATSDTGELDGTGERVALMLQPPPPHMLMGWRHPLRQTASTSTKLLRHRLGPASSLLHAPTSYYYDYHAVRDRRGRTTRAGAADAPAALHRLMDTDEAMDDAHIYTTTIIMHGEREAKTEDDDYSSLIGGAPAS